MGTSVVEGVLVLWTCGALPVLVFPFPLRLLFPPLTGGEPLLLAGGALAMELYVEKFGLPSKKEKKVNDPERN